MSWQPIPGLVAQALRLVASLLVLRWVIGAALSAWEGVTGGSRISAVVFLAGLALGALIAGPPLLFHGGLVAAWVVTQVALALAAAGLAIIRPSEGWPAGLGVGLGLLALFASRCAFDVVADLPDLLREQRHERREGGERAEASEQDEPRPARLGLQPGAVGDDPAGLALRDPDAGSRGHRRAGPEHQSQGRQPAGPERRRYL